MRLKHVVIKNFKGIRSLEFPTEDSPHALRGLTALLGDNGSGKTTVLQAIALTLSLATRRTKNIRTFDWRGFLPERVSSLGPTFVELLVSFEPSEMAIARKMFHPWRDSLPAEARQTNRIAPPSDRSEVVIRFERGRISSPDGPEARSQFLGRYFIRSIQHLYPSFATSLAELGDVFWFDQHRDLGFMTRGDENNSQRTGGQGSRRSWQTGVEELREYLVGWWGFHATPERRGKDFLPLLETAFRNVFPGARFVGIMPRSGIASPRSSDFYFLIDRDDRVYDLAEMSSGEQAVFPLVYEFVRLDMKRSVVLVDELELHLHPPEQQRLLSALPQIGPDCQFLITTHSEFLTAAIPDEQEVRLERGTRCL